MITPPKWLPAQYSVLHIVTGRNELVSHGCALDSGRGAHSGLCYQTHSFLSVVRRGQVDRSWFNWDSFVKCWLSDLRRIKNRTERVMVAYREQCRNLTFSSSDLKAKVCRWKRKRFGIGQFNARSFGADDPVFVLVCYDDPSKRTEIYKKILEGIRAQGRV